MAEVAPPGHVRAVGACDVRQLRAEHDRVQAILEPRLVDRVEDFGLERRRCRRVRHALSQDSDQDFCRARILRGLIHNVFVILDSNVDCAFVLKGFRVNFHDFPLTRRPGAGARIFTHRLGKYNVLRGGIQGGY